MYIILTAVKAKKDAVQIGRGLLKKKLIACYNIIPMESSYWWKGKITKGSEILMFLKAPKRNFKKIEEYIKKHSSYEIPEIIAIRPEKINASYLKWISAETA